MSTLLFARYELLALRRDPRAWASAVCLFVLMAAALASSVQMQRAYERTRDEAQQASHRSWLGQGSKNAHSAAHFGVYAFRPLPELAPFEPGLHGVLGTTVWLEAHKANDMRDAPDEDGSRMSYLGNSAAFLARTVLPLLVFLLVASSIAGERERGTLKMLLAQGASITRIAAGKLLAFAALLIALILLAALVSGGGARAFGLAAGYTLFALVTLFVAMAVSLRASDSRRALVALFAVWTLGAVLGPRMAASVASALTPMPLRSEAQAALERELDSSGYIARTDALRAKTLAEHGVTRPEELPFDFRGLALQRDEEHGYEVFDRHRAELRSRETQQDDVLEGASLLIPWLALEQWSTAVAGTDRRHAEHFADAAESYRRNMVKSMNDFILHAHGANADEALWSKIPEFRYQAPPLAMDYAWRSLAILALWTAASLALALTFARRAALGAA